jgi:hypothetical protein
MGRKTSIVALSWKEVFEADYDIDEGGSQV